MYYEKHAYIKSLLQLTTTNANGDFMQEKMKNMKVLHN